MFPLTYVYVHFLLENRLQKSIDDVPSLYSTTVRSRHYAPTSSLLDLLEFQIPRKEKEGRRSVLSRKEGANGDQEILMDGQTEKRHWQLIAHRTAHTATSWIHQKSFSVGQENNIKQNSRGMIVIILRIKPIRYSIV